MPNLVNSASLWTVQLSRLSAQRKPFPRFSWSLWSKFCQFTFRWVENPKTTFLDPECWFSRQIYTRLHNLGTIKDTRKDSTRQSGWWIERWRVYSLLQTLGTFKQCITLSLDLQTETETEDKLSTADVFFFRTSSWWLETLLRPYNRRIPNAFKRYRRRSKRVLSTNIGNRR